MTLAFLARVPCEVKKSWVPSVSPSGDPQTDESRHTHLWVSSVLLSVELGTQAADASAGCPCHRRDGAHTRKPRRAVLLVGNCLSLMQYLLGCCKPFVVFHSFNSIGSDSYCLVFFFLCFCQIRECGASLLCSFADFSLWFWFAFPWWLMKLNVFLHMLISHLYIFFQIWPSFNWVICLLLNCKSSLYIVHSGPLYMI